MDDKGQVVAGIITMAVLMMFTVLYLFFTPMFNEIWDLTEEETPNAPSSIWSNLHAVWPLTIIIGAILIFVFMFARAARTEHEYEVFRG